MNKNSLPSLMFLVPLMAFWITGGLVGALSLLLSWPWLVSFIAGFVGALIAFGWFVNRVADVFYPKAQPVKVEAKSLEVEVLRQVANTTKVAIIEKGDSDNYLSGEYASLSVDPRRLRIFAQGVLAGKGFALGVWTGSTGIFSRDEYDTLRSELIERGILRWKNENAHAQGVELTRAGESFFRYLVEDEPEYFPPPLPENETVFVH